MEKNNNNNTTLPFIKTSDKETMEQLVKIGFEMIDCSGGFWTFLNCPEKTKKMNFKEKSKIVYSKMLCI